ncbi:MAG TPA: nuclear transport factor 2 family protein [Acidocella sp.]|jgi:hypothetical protein|nr:nuclear transport factor 2 family protein [Acidocella sp.]
MEQDIAALVREMKDRQDIYDCIMRYCRGVDRLDRELTMSAYHADGIDDHGPYVGPREGFWDYVMDVHGKKQERTLHHVTNHYCELDGDVAHAESYFLFYSLNREAPLYTLVSGRYIDRFEKREGRWGIAERICVVDVRNEAWAPTGHEGDELYMQIHRGKEDPSYMRPLHVDRARFTGPWR